MNAPRFLRRNYHLRLAYAWLHGPKSTWHWTRLIRPGDVVVDVGAHQGYYSWFAERRGASRVLAFEPYMPSLRILKRELPSPIVEQWCVALSDKCGTAPYYTDAANSAANSLYPLDGVAPGWTETVTLDSLELPKVDVLKIDAEGAECRVLAGAVKTISRSPDLRLFVEFNPERLVAAGDLPGYLSTMIRAQGFTLRHIDEHSGRLLDTWPDAPAWNAIGTRDR